MQLVVGLGNPGARYARTRHNVGFRCLEALASRLGLVFGEVQPQYRAAVGEGPAGPVTLLQPLTFMNRSGEALAAWSRLTGRRIDAATPESAPDPGIVPIVVCDDLNLGLGSLRIRGGGGDGGQNGLASILRTVGSEQVPRLRLGIGGGPAQVLPEAWADYVLAEFAPAEQEAAAAMIERGAEAMLCLLEHGWELAAARFNRRLLEAADSEPDPGSC